jgi:hypothetical protein
MALLARQRTLRRSWTPGEEATASALGELGRGGVLGRSEPRGTLEISLLPSVVPPLRRFPVVSRARNGLIREHIRRLHVEMGGEASSCVVTNRVRRDGRDGPPLVVHHFESQARDPQHGLERSELDAPATRLPPRDRGW